MDLSITYNKDFDDIDFYDGIYDYSSNFNLIGRIISSEPFGSNFTKINVQTKDGEFTAFANSTTINSIDKKLMNTDAIILGFIGFEQAIEYFEHIPISNISFFVSEIQYIDYD